MARTYTIDIPDGVFSGEVPFMLPLFLKKGIRSLEQDEFYVEEIK